MTTTSTRLIEDKDEDLVLEFCVRVLGLRSLHWGVWEKGEELTIDNLRRAQERFSHVLKEHIPAGVKSILDIGCGVGDNALFLAQQGYVMTCISPDAHHKSVFDKIKHKNILFHHSSIERFLTHKTFDAVLMSESAHYFDKDLAFKKFQDIVRDKGYVIVAGLFRKEHTTEYAYFPVENEWVKSAENHGFGVVNRTNITQKVLPTSMLGKRLLKNNLLPGIGIITKYIRRRSPVQYKVLRWIFTKQTRELSEYFRIGPIPEMFNPQLFRSKARYVIYVLKKK